MVVTVVDDLCHSRVRDGEVPLLQPVGEIVGLVFDLVAVHCRVENEAPLEPRDQLVPVLRNGREERGPRPRQQVALPLDERSAVGLRAVQVQRVRLVEERLVPQGAVEFLSLNPKLVEERVALFGRHRLVLLLRVDVLVCHLLILVLALLPRHVVLRDNRRVVRTLGRSLQSLLHRKRPLLHLGLLLARQLLPLASQVALLRDHCASHPAQHIRLGRRLL
mmetsp:Transcript_34948/g.82852  ORF Transcript_34948/g.82852 Transcript_34948/m.82852 type:complete len:220 (-) Transcript_34948:256-915(-)